MSLGKLGYSARFDVNPGCSTTEGGKGLKFQIQKEEGFYYMCSKTKGADYRAADLRLCFRICKKQGFSLCGSSHLSV